MQKPEVYECDLCHQVIRERPFAYMSVPMTHDDARQIRQHIDTCIPRSILGLGRAFAMPTYYQFHMHAECVLGLLPDLGRLKMAAIAKILDDMRAKAEAS